MWDSVNVRYFHHYYELPLSSILIEKWLISLCLVTILTISSTGNGERSGGPRCP